MAKLILRVPGGSESEISLDDKDSVTIGRSPECDMPIEDGQASRRHASVTRSGEGYEVADLGSTNGTLLNDIQVKQRALRHGDVIKIGATEIEYDDPGAAPAAGGDEGACCLVYAKGGRKGQKVELSAQRTTIGRKESNTLVLDDGVASSYHCEIVRDLNGYTLRDLGSTNGTMVNNELVTETALMHGARVRIGNTRFVFQDPAMAEVDLDLAGVDDDEAEWGMMRDLDLASVRRRNPSTYIYLVLFLAICGALYYLTQLEQKRDTTATRGPEGSLVSDYGFERRTSALAWESDAATSVDVNWSDGALRMSAGDSGGAAFYAEEIEARNNAFRLTGRCSGDGRLGLRFRGSGLEQWKFGDGEGSAIDFEVSAPPWAFTVDVGVLFESGGRATIDDVALVRRGPARVDSVEQGSFQLKVVDGRQVELLYGGTPILAMGRLVSADASGKTSAAGDLTVSATKDGDQGFAIRITGGSGAASLGVEFVEVGGYLTQEGWRAFTPDQETEFHAAFPAKGALRLSGVRKMLVGGRGRAFSCIAAEDAGRLSTIAEMRDGNGTWTILGAAADGDADGGAAFRIRTNLRGETVLAQDAVTKARQLHDEQRWGEFLDAASSVLAEFPFLDTSTKRRLNEMMSEVGKERSELQRDARRELADYEEFKDMQSLDRVREKLDALAGRHQVKAGEGRIGETWQKLDEAERDARQKARTAQETKKADPIFALAMVAVADEEWSTAATLLWDVVHNLPNAAQVKDAKTELDNIEKSHPEVVKVLRDVLGGS